MSATEAALFPPVRVPGRRHLIAKLILCLIAFFVIFIPVLVGLEVWQTYQREAESQQRTLAAVAAAFRQPLAGAVWNEDAVGIEAQIESVAQFPDVGRVRLRADLGGSPGGRVFEAGAAPAGGATLTVTLPAPAAAGPHEPLGELELETDVAALNQTLKAQTLGIVVAATVQVLGIGLLLIWAIRHLVAQPLGVLVHHVEALGETLTTPPLPSPRVGDTVEFGVLSLGINRMQARLSHDIAELVLLKDELAHHGERLEALVAERTRELTEAKRVAETANRLKGQFLATVSHEIRTPMNAVIGFAHLLLKGDLTARQHDYVLKMQTATQNLLRMVNDILDFSKIEAGAMKVECVPFAIVRVVSDAMAVIQPKALEKGLMVHINIAPDVPPLLMGDPIRLGQVLLNLLANAVKFTERGGVTVSVGSGDEDGDGGGGGEVFDLRISVQDSGLGMTAAQMSTLFQAFNQLDSSTTRRFGGTGLGLAICREIVTLMGGEIGVDSTPGRGSVFWFRVPSRIAFSGAAGRMPLDGPAPVPAPLPPDSGGDVRPDPDHVCRAEALAGRLDALLTQGDPQAGELAQELAALLVATPVAAQADRVARLAEAFDFDDAAAILGPMRLTLTSWLETV